MRMPAPVKAKSSCLNDFTCFLQRSRNSSGRIETPLKNQRETTKYLSRRPVIPISIVEEIVAAIDYEKSAICSRLDLHGFLLIYKILSLTEECLAYQRGLCLLAQSLHESSASSLPEQDLRTTKKVQLGKKSLLFLVGCFVRAELTPRTRRWMGILALELLQGNDQNKEMLLEAPQNTWRCLGDLVLDGTCQTLKLIAGLIIHEMWPDAAPTKELWPAPRDPEIYRRFPKANDQNSQWIIEFANFATDIVVPQNPTSRESHDVVLAYAVSVGEMTYHMNNESTILVTVSDEINIVIPASTTSSAMYIDITIDQIQGISLGTGSSLSQSDSSRPEGFEVLTIWMSKFSEETFYFNAVRQSADSINLAFTSPEAVATIQKSLGGRITNSFRASQSEPIDISRLFLNELDESPAAYPARLVSDDLVNAASKASALLEQSSAALVNQISHAKDDGGNQSDCLSQLRFEAPSSPRNIMPMQQRKKFVHCAMSPIEPHQFDEFSVNLNVEHFEETSDGLQNPGKKLEDDSPTECSSAAQAHQHCLMNGYYSLPVDCGPVESALVQLDEDQSSPSCEAIPGFLNTSQKQFIELSRRRHESVELKRPAKIDAVHYSQNPAKSAGKAKTELSPSSRSTPGSRKHEGRRRKVGPKTPSKKAKIGRNQGDRLFSPKNAPKTRKVDMGPLPLARSRNIRAAALNAKKKIQGIIESESSEAKDGGTLDRNGTSPACLDDESRGSPSPGHSSDKTRNSGTSSVLSGNDKRQFLENGNNKTNLKASAEAISRGERNQSPGSSDSVDLLANELVKKTAGVSICATNKRRRKPEITLLDRTDKAQQTPSNNSEEGQKSVRKMFISNLNHVSPFIYGDEIFMSKDHTSDQVDMIDSIEGGFFEEAIAFSYESTRNVIDKLNKFEIPETPVRELKNARLRDCNMNDTSTGVSIAAKLQNALSSVISLHSKGTEQRLPKMKALTPSALLAPQPHKNVSEKVPSARLSRDLVKEKPYSDRKTRPQPLRPRSDNRTPVRNSDKIESINEGPKMVVGKTVEECKKLNEGRETSRPKQTVKTPMDVDRKCNIISFDSKGPRNQGILSFQKPRRRAFLEHGSPELSSNVRFKTVKRKSQDLDEGELSSGQPVAIIKRQRNCVGIPRTREQSCTGVKERDSSGRNSVPKASSQSTRVDENGSPLPFVHSRKLGLKGYEPNILVGAAAQLNNTKEADSGNNGCTMLENTQDESYPNVLFPQALPSAASVQYIPSADALSGAIDHFAAHKVSPSGNFVNLQTNNVVMTVRPSDPFAELQQEDSKDFIAMLRRSPNNPSKQKSHTHAAVMNEDADKTLVETGSAQSKDSSSTASGTSSSSGSSRDSSYSGDSSPPEDPSSSEGGDGEEDDWAVSLQPHQGETLEALYDISLSVVRNLVYKEKVVRDLASDYRCGGNRIIDEFEKSRQRDLFTYQTRIKTLKENLAATYKTAQRELEAGLISLERKFPRSDA